MKPTKRRRVHAAEERYQKLLDQLVSLTAAARTTGDANQAKKSLDEAARIACNVVQLLKRDLPPALSRLQEKIGTDDSRTTLVLRDLSYANEHLIAFRSREEFERFLASTSDLLLARLNYAKQSLKQLFKEFVGDYDRLVTTKLSREEIEGALERLESCYCRGPDQGPGGVLAPNDDGPKRGPGDAKEERQERAVGLFADLAAIVTFVWEVAKHAWPSIFNSTEAEGTLPVPYEVMAVIAPVVFANRIADEFGEAAVKELAKTPAPAYA